MPALNTTLIPDTSPSEEPPDSWFIQFLWLPYVLLGAILIGMALASFIHYHIQNRGKYADQKYKKDRNNIPMVEHEKPKKYRVTLNSRGVVSAAESKNHVSEVLKQEGKKDLFAASSTYSKDSASTITNKGNTGSVTSTSTGAYVNESYDSNCDSDKSLLNENNELQSANNRKRLRDKSPLSKGGVKSPKVHEKRHESDQAAEDNKHIARLEEKNRLSNGRKAISMDTITPDNQHFDIKARSLTYEHLCSSVPPSTARLETPDLPDNSMGSKSDNDHVKDRQSNNKAQVNILKVHEAQRQ